MGSGAVIEKVNLRYLQVEYQHRRCWRGTAGTIDCMEATVFILAPPVTAKVFSLCPPVGLLVELPLTVRQTMRKACNRMRIVSSS
jgi:hypothetical protein